MQCVRIEMQGKIFHKWTVLSKARLRHGSVLYWNCKCECGTLREVRGSHLRGGRSKDCGCGRKETVREMGYNRRKEGCTKTQKYKQYQKDAKSRGVSWDLTFDEFLSLASQNCNYCGSEPKNRHTNESKTEEFLYQGIDKIDPTTGYSIENCVPCCYQCNLSKNNYTLIEFLIWIESVYKHSFKNKIL